MNRVWSKFSSAIGCICIAMGCGLLEPRERTRTFEIAHNLVDCVGVGPQKCMLVRRLPETSWTFFYDGIEGFTYEAGYVYVVRVAERRIDNPPADGSSLAYRLLGMTLKAVCAEPPASLSNPPDECF